MKNEIRAEQMAQVLKAQSCSGLSKKAFCAEHGITPSMFYYWQRRLSEGQGSPVPEPNFRQVVLDRSAELELRLPGGQWIGVRASSVRALGLLVEAIVQRHA